MFFVFFFQAEDGIRDPLVTGVQTCALPICDTGFVLEDQQVARFAANYERQGDGSLKMIDNPEQSNYRKRSFFSGGGGLLSTAPDYFRFTSMLQNMGELDGVRLLGRQTVELMTMNHLPGGQDLNDLAQAGMFTETAYAGVGFGLGFSVVPASLKTQMPGSPGEFAGGWSAST